MEVDKNSIPENLSNLDTINIIIDNFDLIYTENDSKLYMAKAGRGSMINGIFYFVHEDEEYKVINYAFDPYYFNKIEVILFDLDKKYPPEVISIWHYESETYEIRVDKINNINEVINIYMSKALGRPISKFTYTLIDHSILFIYQLEDGSAHVVATLDFSSEMKIDLRELFKIPWRVE